MEPTLRKPRHRRAVRINVTLSPILFDAVGEIVKRSGYSGVSDYLQAKIRRDAKLDPEDRIAA